MTTDVNRGLWHLGAAMSLLVLTDCSEPASLPEPIIRPVRTQPVLVTGADRVRSFAGTAQAAMESRLSFKVAGTVERVAVAVGDHVDAGQTLASLQARDFQLQTQEAEAQLASAEAQARNADANYARVRALYENRNASLNDLDAARAAAESARQMVKSVDKRLQLSRVQLGYTQLPAPVAGVIAQVRIEENENVSPGQAAITLNAGSDVEVGVAVPEMLIARIREGDAVSVQFDALGGQSLAARVTEVGVGSGGRATYPVTVLLTEAHPDCRPGMAANVKFRFGDGSGRERAYVPAAAVGEDRQGRYVFVVATAEDSEQATVHRRAVTTGELGADGLEILEGLQDGDVVVTAGVSRITDGQRVRLL